MSAGFRNSRVVKSEAPAQLTFAFDDVGNVDGEFVPGAIAQSIRAMPKPVVAPVPMRSANAAAVPSAEESLAEADRLINEGLILRYAAAQRRYLLQGPLNFTDPPRHVPSVHDVGEFVPTFLKKRPENWVVSEAGFTYALLRPDALAISRLVNARRSDLGVFICVRDGEGWKIVFDS